MIDPTRPRRVSLELERHLAYDGNVPSGQGPLGPRPLGPASPSAFQAVLDDLARRGWQVEVDPVTCVPSKVMRDGFGDGTDDIIPATCTSDVTSAIFETTLSPAADIGTLASQQRRLDNELVPLLRDRELFLWNVETPPAIVPSREHYALFHTYWRGQYAMRRHRGEDHYWYAWTIGNSPNIDVSPREAIPFLNMIIRLTGATLFLSRNGALSGGKLAPDGRLTVRPWALKQLWCAGPYRADMLRCALMPRDFHGLHDYLGFLAGLPTVVYTNEANQPERVRGDPSFGDLWLDPSRRWTTIDAHGQEHERTTMTVEALHGVQKGVVFSRLRWQHHPDTQMSDLAAAFTTGSATFDQQFCDSLSRLYLEVRSDGCPPHGEEFATLALYLGLLEVLPEAHELIVDKTSKSFWRSLFVAAESEPLHSLVDGVWVPDLLASLLRLAETGLRKRGLNEQRFLQPLWSRLETGRSPAEEVLRVFADAGGAAEGLAAVGETFRTHDSVGEGQRR